MQLTVDWKIKTLGEIAEVQSGGTPLKSRNEYWFGDIPWYSSGELNETFTKAPKELITPKGLEESNAKLFPKGSLLIGMYDTAALKMSILDRDAAFNQAIAGVKPNEKIDLKFILYAVNSRKFEILNQRRGVRQKNLSLAKIKNIALPIPPLPEQKRIVAILDEAFEGIDRAIANTEKNLANSRELFESYLNAVFTQKGNGWVESNLGTVCKFQGGSQPPKSAFSAEKKEGYIRLIQIRDYKSDKYIVYIPKGKAKRFCKPDDVMIGRYGPPLFQILRGLEGAYNVALMKAIPNEEFVSKDFLFYFLKNRNILNYIISSSSRTAGQTGLNKATIEPYPIAFPTLEKQAIIVAQLQEIKAETQRLEAIYCQKLAALKELKQSILQKAFTGELTADTPKTVKEEIAA